MSTFASLVFESSHLWPLAAAAGSALTAGLVWLYPPQLRDNGMLGWVTCGLRWLALIALVLALLKPVFVAPNSELENGAIVLVVDCSKSMSVADTGRTPAERVSLAAALGRLPENLRNESSTLVLEQIRKAESLAQSTLAAQSDLDYARVSGRSIGERLSNLQKTAARYTEAARGLVEQAEPLSPGTELRAGLSEVGNVPTLEAREAWSKLPGRLAALRHLAEAVQAEADRELYLSNSRVRDICDRLSQISRLSLVEEALFDRKSGLAAALLRMGPVSCYAAGAALQHLDLPEAGSDSWTRLRADGERSDLTGALSAVVTGTLGRAVKAIVLFSDGRQVGGRGDVISALRPSGVPVFAINVTPAHVPDAWIQAVSLSSSASAFAGEPVEGHVEVRCRGLTDLPRNVTISGAAGRQQVPLTRQGRTAGPAVELTAHFAMPVASTGTGPSDKLTFSIPNQPAEVTDQNNHVERWVKVISERVNVALCSAAPTRDFQFLRGALSNRPWVRAQTEMLDPEHPRMDLAPLQLLRQDVVVLDDVPVQALDVNQWDAINRLVNDRGGSVIIIAGPSDAPADYAQQPIAAALLPFHDVRPTWKTWPGEQPAFRFVPTPLGERETLRLADGADEMRRWQELPAVYRYLQVPDRNIFPDVRKLLLESDSGSVVLSERKVGAGRTFFVGLDETWRWRRNNGEAAQDRFWRQLVRHAAGERYAVTNGPVALDVDPVACEPGDPVTIHARILDGPRSELGAKTLALEVRRDGRSWSTLLLGATGRGRFVGQVRDLPVGEYQLQVRAGGGGTKSAASMPLHVSVSDEPEMRDVSGDQSTLLRIARASGGEALSIEEVGRLPQRLGTLRQTESQLVRLPLYSSPLLFVFILSCLAGEWALRKRLGLA